MLKRKLALSLITIATVSTLVAGASFALFSATTTNANNTFTAGTVTLNDPVSMAVAIGPIAPGDSGTVRSFDITYTGNLPAWIGLDTTTSGDLFTGDNPLEVTITDGSQTFSANAANQVVGTAVQNDVKHFDVNYSMPINAGNEYQGDTGTLNIQVKAVQSANNTNAAGTGPLNWN